MKMDSIESLRFDLDEARCDIRRLQTRVGDLEAAHGWPSEDAEPGVVHVWSDGTVGPTRPITEADIGKPLPSVRTVSAEELARELAAMTERAEVAERERDALQKHLPTWRDLEAREMAALADFPAAWIPRLSFALLLDPGRDDQVWLSSHKALSRPGRIVGPSAWLAVLREAGREGGTVADLARCYGADLDRAWVPFVEPDLRMALNSAAVRAALGEAE